MKYSSLNAKRSQKATGLLSFLKFPVNMCAPARVSHVVLVCTYAICCCCCAVLCFAELALAWKLIGNKSLELHLRRRRHHYRTGVLWLLEVRRVDRALCCRYTVRIDCEALQDIVILIKVFAPSKRFFCAALHCLSLLAIIHHAPSDWSLYTHTLPWRRTPAMLAKH